MDTPTFRVSYQLTIHLEIIESYLTDLSRKRDKSTMSEKSPIPILQVSISKPSF